MTRLFYNFLFENWHWSYLLLLWLISGQLLELCATNVYRCLRYLPNVSEGISSLIVLPQWRSGFFFPVFKPLSSIRNLDRSPQHGQSGFFLPVSHYLTVAKLRIVIRNMGVQGSVWWVDNRLNPHADLYPCPTDQYWQKTQITSGFAP